jgi:hypothetical protein
MNKFSITYPSTYNSLDFICAWSWKKLSLQATAIKDIATLTFPERSTSFSPCFRSYHSFSSCPSLLSQLVSLPPVWSYLLKQPILNCLTEPSTYTYRFMNISTSKYNTRLNTELPKQWGYKVRQLHNIHFTVNLLQLCFSQRGRVRLVYFRHFNTLQTVNKIQKSPY